MVTAGAKGLEERGQQQGWWVVVQFYCILLFSIFFILQLLLNKSLLVVYKIINDHVVKVFKHDNQYVKYSFILSSIFLWLSRFTIRNGVNS